MHVQKVHFACLDITDHSALMKGQWQVHLQSRVLLLADVLGGPGLAEKMPEASCSLCLISSDVAHSWSCLILSTIHAVTSIYLFPQEICFW